MTTTLRETKSGWSARIRMGAGQRPWLPMPPMKSTEAEARRERLQRLATEFVRAGKAGDATHSLRLCAEQPTPKAFDAFERAARRLLTEDPEAKPAELRTFRDIAERWTSGALHLSRPDGVRPKVEAARAMDRAILKTFYPLLGDKPIAAVTRADTEKAKLAVPRGLEPSTRRVYLSRCRYIFKLAVKFELIDAVPMNAEFVPKPVDGREFWFLYPEEEEQLVSCIEIPFAFRLLYGFLCRNGSRIGETLRLTYGHIDWRRGVVRLEKQWTKTKHGRFWKLDSDVLRALRRHFIATGRDSSRAIFTLDDGRRITRAMVDTRFIGDVKTAGIERPELLDSTADSRRLRAHDCRGTFVTLARKTGRRFDGDVEIIMTDRWIMDRTGHETIEMLAKYERFVRHATNLNLGWLAPLDQCLYPQADPSDLDQDMDQETQNLDGMAVSRNPQRIASALPTPSEGLKTAAAARSNSTGRRLGPPQTGGVVQRTGPERVALKLGESSLRRLLELATKAREWAIAGELTAQLGAVEEARPGNVTHLDDRRKR